MTHPERPDFIRDAIAMLRRCRPSAGLWLASLAGLALVAGLPLLIYPLAIVASEAAMLAIGAAYGLGSLLLTAWLLCGLVRSAAGQDRPLRADRALAKMGALHVFVFGVVADQLLFLAVALLPGTATVADSWLKYFLLTVVVQVALLQLAPWLASLALGDRLGLARSWRGMRGARLPLARAWLALVAPFAAIHLAIALVLDAAWIGTGTGWAAVTIVDVLARTAMLGLFAILAVLGWAVARERTAGLEEAPSTRR